MADKPPFVKYESIVSFSPRFNLDSFLKGREVQVFEKIDGGNCQVRQQNYQLFPGNRANFLSGKKIHAHPWFEKFTKWVYTNSSLYGLPEDVIMFGEWSGNHTIDYGSENSNQFYLIDLLDLNSRRFFPYREAVKALGSFGVVGVHSLDVLMEGHLTSKDVTELLGRPSKLYDGYPEGVVVKDYSTSRQEFVKVYHPTFAEKREELGRVDYLLPPRFSKAIFRLRDDDLPVTEEKVIAAVIADVMKEGGGSISPGLVEDKLRYFLRSSKLGQAAKLLNK